VTEAFQRVIPGFEAPGGVPPWARIGDEPGLATALDAAGLAGVGVDVVTKRWRWDDPEAFFLSQPEWSPPSRPLFEEIDDATAAGAAAAFVDVVAEATARAGGDGLAVEAQLGHGTVP
jgi:hypothetical protein